MTVPNRAITTPGSGAWRGTGRASNVSDFLSDIRGTQYILPTPNCPNCREFETWWFGLCPNGRAITLDRNEEGSAYNLSKRACIYATQLDTLENPVENILHGYGEGLLAIAETLRDSTSETLAAIINMILREHMWPLYFLKNRQIHILGAIAFIKTFERKLRSTPSGGDMIEIVRAYMVSSLVVHIFSLFFYLYKQVMDALITLEQPSEALPLPDGTVPAYQSHCLAAAEMGSLARKVLDGNKDETVGLQYTELYRKLIFFDEHDVKGLSDDSKAIVYCANMLILVAWSCLYVHLGTNYDNGAVCRELKPVAENIVGQLSFDSGWDDRMSTTSDYLKAWLLIFARCLQVLDNEKRDLAMNAYSGLACIFDSHHGFSRTTWSSCRCISLRSTLWLLGISQRTSVKGLVVAQKPTAWSLEPLRPHRRLKQKGTRLLNSSIACVLIAISRTEDAGRYRKYLLYRIPRNHSANFVI